MPLAERNKVRLTVERPVVHRGKSAFGRVENRGKGTVGFGVFYDVQRRIGQRWRHVPGAGVFGGPEIELILLPGQAGYCMRHHLPEDAPTGPYRFTRELSGRTYAVEFRVVP